MRPSLRGEEHCCTDTPHLCACARYTRPKFFMSAQLHLCSSTHARSHRTLTRHVCPDVHPADAQANKEAAAAAKRAKQEAKEKSKKGASFWDSLAVLRRSPKGAHARTRADVHTHTHTHTCTHTHFFTNANTYLQMHTRTLARRHMHARMRMCTHTRTHAHTLWPVAGCSAVQHMDEWDLLCMSLHQATGGSYHVLGLLDCC